MTSSSPKIPWDRVPDWEISSAVNAAPALWTLTPVQEHSSKFGETPDHLWDQCGRIYFRIVFVHGGAE